MPSPPDPHGWNSWTSYLAAHEGKLKDFRDHFLVEDHLRHLMAPELVNWTGELICRDGYELHVRRLQVVDLRNGVPWVKTSRYSYHAMRRRMSATTNLFRYDNIHVHEGHPTEHHRHGYDRAGNEVTPPAHIGYEGWPNLGQVLDELHAYWTERL